MENKREAEMKTSKGILSKVRLVFVLLVFQTLSFFVQPGVASVDAANDWVYIDLRTDLQAVNITGDYMLAQSKENCTLRT